MIRLVASMRPRPDAAENVLHADGREMTVRGFNEAAARCRGKRTFHRRLDRRPIASMRPRPDAAENDPLAGGRRHRVARASMRPRPDAAENLDLVEQPGTRDLLASMRPRPDAAENLLREDLSSSLVVGLQ